MAAVPSGRVLSSGAGPVPVEPRHRRGERPGQRWLLKEVLLSGNAPLQKNWHRILSGPPQSLSLALLASATSLLWGHAFLVEVYDVINHLRASIRASFTYKTTNQVSCGFWRGVEGALGWLPLPWGWTSLPGCCLPRNCQGLCLCSSKTSKKGGTWADSQVKRAIRATNARWQAYFNFLSGNFLW